MRHALAYIWILVTILLQLFTSGENQQLVANVHLLGRRSDYHTLDERAGFCRREFVNSRFVEYRRIVKVIRCLSFVRAIVRLNS